LGESVRISELGPFSIKDADRGEKRKVPAKHGKVEGVSQSDTAEVGKESPEAMKTGRLLNLIEEAQKRAKAKKAKAKIGTKMAIEAYLATDEIESKLSALGMRLQIKV
jgi:hypothetical protein